MSAPNMNLSLPTVLVTEGPDWASQLVTALETIDEHDHSSGKGVRITPAGLNISSDLEFNDNSATELKSAKFNQQPSTLTGASNAGSVYSVSGDLYYTNFSGTSVQITSGGTIVSTPASASTFEVTLVSTNLTISPASSFVYLIVDTTASRTITLPLASAVSSGRIYIVKDSDGQSEANPITVDTQGSDTVDGLASQDLNSNYGSWIILGDGTSSWYIS